MNKTDIDRNSYTPIYVQLMELIRNKIRKGKILPGQSIPSERELMKRYKLNQVTVAKALSELVYENLVYRIQGKGTFVREGLPEGIARKAMPRFQGIEEARNQSIGLAVYEIDYFNVNSFADFLKGVMKVTNKEGYNLQLTSTNPEYKKGGGNLYFMSLIDRRVLRGLIVYDRSITDQQIFHLKSSKIPFILVNRNIPRVKLNTVMVDNCKGFYRLTEHLINRGHRRIGLVITTRKSDAEKEHLAGYRQALKQHHLRLDRRLVKELFKERKISDRIKSERGIMVREKVKELLKLKPRPTAIIFNDDDYAVIGMKLIKAKGLHIPADIAIASNMDKPISSFVEPPLTTLRQPGQRIGTVAIKLLCELIKGKKPANSNPVIEQELVIRKSCSMEFQR